MADPEQLAAQQLARWARAGLPLLEDGAPVPDAASAPSLRAVLVPGETLGQLPLTSEDLGRFEAMAAARGLPLGKVLLGAIALGATAERRWRPGFRRRRGAR